MQPRVLVGRGVYEEPFYATVGGWVTLCAVTSQGMCVAKAVVDSESDYDREHAWLWMLLYEVDPISSDDEARTG